MAIRVAVSDSQGWMWAPGWLSVEPRGLSAALVRVVTRLRYGPPADVGVLRLPTDRLPAPPACQSDAVRTAWKPSPSRLDGRLADSVGASLTYPDVGATADPRLPKGHNVIDQTAVVGSGRAAWERVADALLRWDLHRAAHMVLAVSAPAVRSGCTVVNVACLGPVGLLAPCRVVAVVDEPARRGFAYGTLPGHPLSGEEQFTVQLGRRRRCGCASARSAVRAGSPGSALRRR